MTVTERGRGEVRTGARGRGLIRAGVAVAKAEVKQAKPDGAKEPDAKHDVVARHRFVQGQPGGAQRQHGRDQKRYLSFIEPLARLPPQHAPGTAKRKA